MSRTRKSQTRTCTCSRCQQGRSFNGTRRAAFAAQDVATLNVEVVEAQPTGGVDDYGDCWGTRVGQDPACSCWTCGEVWLSLWSRQDPVWCDRCGTSECVLD